MAFDGVKTEEPKTPPGMTAIRLIVGYNTYGVPVMAPCSSTWEIIGCEREHYNDDDDDDEDQLPVGKVQRIMFFVPTQAPAAKVAKAMDLSELVKVDETPVSIDIVLPDAEDKSIWD